MNKSELLNWLNEQDRQWETILDQVGRSRMDIPGVNGAWSMKDMIAHLTGWNRWLVIRLQAAQLGEPEPPPPWPSLLQTDDDINAWLYEANRGYSVDEILDEVRDVYQQLLSVIKSLPDDVRIEHVEPTFNLVWVDGKRFEAGEFFNHFHDDHEPDVLAWLSQVNKQ
jgi:hypothetical protein